ncbi:hypothetical protein [Furfurilactobacillus cerevisiae]|uniref:hypothetical protein n=1 Tax=Furfurilactobacillus rossiae TaxID=231049 RepID=UPI003B981AC6
MQKKDCINFVLELKSLYGDLEKEVIIISEINALAGYLSAHNIMVKTIAETVDKSPNTVSKKIKQIVPFNVFEIKQLNQKLKIPIHIFFD